MIQADIVRYRFSRYLDQGDTPECSAYAFLGVLAELVENQTGVKTDFDYSGEFHRLKLDKAKDRMRTLSNHLTGKGFLTTDGRLVSGISIRMGKESTQKKQDKRLIDNLQTYGAGVVVINYNGNTNLKTNKDGLLTKIYEYVKGASDNYGHAVGLVGFNNLTKTYDLANSWGARDSDRSITYESLYGIFNTCQFFDKITVNNILI